MKTIRLNHRLIWRIVTIALLTFAWLLFLALPSRAEEAVTQATPTTEPGMTAQQVEAAALRQRLVAQLQELQKQPATPETEKKRATLQLQMLNLVGIGSNSGDVVLAGDVVDEQGAPLENVAMTITRSRATGFGVGNDEKETRRIDGKFQASAKGVAVALISFAKDGYYTESLGLYLNDRRQIATELSDYMGKDGRLKIVLLKKEKPTVLKTSSFTLEVATDGSATMADPMPILEDKDPRIIKAQSVHAKDLPPTALYVTVDRDEDGTFRFDPTDAAKYYHYPALIRIGMADPKGGLVPKKSKSGKRDSITFRRAPAEGYLQEIDFAPWKSRASFYLKIAGKYGRGKVDDIHFAEDGKSFTFRISIEMQPDGSRNLETGE